MMAFRAVIRIGSTPGAPSPYNDRLSSSSPSSSHISSSISFCFSSGVSLPSLRTSATLSMRRRTEPFAHWPAARSARRALTLLMAVCDRLVGRRSRGGGGEFFRRRGWGASPAAPTSIGPKSARAPAPGCGWSVRRGTGRGVGGVAVALGARGLLRPMVASLYSSCPSGSSWALIILDTVHA